jgi:transposase-like protein
VNSAGVAVGSDNKAKNGHSRRVFLNDRATAALMFMKERHNRLGAPKDALVFPGGSSTQ